MKFDNKYIFIFAISVFFLLSITGVGIFLNDEWMTGQQLNQLSQGHQIITNEGKYGYYINGTPGSYMTDRSNILIYSATLPIISLPAYFIFSLLSTTYTRTAIILLWSLLGLYIWYYISKNIINKKLSNILLGLLLLSIPINFILSSPFQMTGEYIPYEIISIGFTNILLYGMFSVVLFKLSELLFDERYKQLVGWISSISFSSLLFWAGTLKDHMIISLFITAICYYQIQFLRTGKDKYAIYSYLLVGLTAWIRPEIALFVAIAIIIFDLYYIRKQLINFIYMGFWIGVGSIPLFINNFITTGNPLNHPFLMSTRMNYLHGYTTEGNLMTVIIDIPQISNNGWVTSALFSKSAIQWIKLLFAPESGALGLIVPLCLFIFSLIAFIKYRQKISKESKLLLGLGISSILYYLINAGYAIGMDNGITPDIRYFTPSYALFTLFAISILPYKLNYKNIFKYIFIIVPTVIIINLFILSIYPPIGNIYTTYRLVPHAISVISLCIMLLILVNSRSTKLPLLEKIIPIAIASAFTWQVIMVFVYLSSKAHNYPIFIPIGEFIYKIMFGG